MERFETKVEDGILYVDSQNGWLKIGRVEDIYDLVGGREYTIQYDDRAAEMAWLDTDENNEINFNVRDQLENMSYTADIVDNLANAEIEEKENGYPDRTSLFADLMTEIWDSKGNVGN